MKRTEIEWTWEDPDAQKSFIDWIGFGDEDESARQVDRIEALLGAKPPSAVLDVGCGTGRHALELARRGYDVVGIDVASSFLDHARGEAKRLGLDVEFRLQRASELDEEAAYDLALAYNHTPGFLSEAELPRHFQGVRTAIKPGGQFLMIYAGPQIVPGHTPDKDSTRNWAEKKGKFILSEKHIDDEGYRNELGIVIDTTAGEIKEFRERQRAFSLVKMVSVLEQAGFTDVETLADLDGGPATAERFKVFVCGS
jgi:cyclopropane fatty-acyl-phospholipid synthase-like methyltransferase